MSAFEVVHRKHEGPVRVLGARIRTFLDALYLACGYLAAASMCAILIITMLQIGGRLTGYNFRGLTDYAGYFMAASAFLAFAHTLNRGAHIRIELLLSVAGKWRRALETVSFAAGIAISAWFAYYCCEMVYWSYQLGDISTGQDATPLWIPQLSMAAGTVLFAVAMADHGFRLLMSGDHGIEQSPDVT
jgi:TRAP-type C4-dicarboxylate transport system permease small subunit